MARKKAISSRNIKKKSVRLDKEKIKTAEKIFSGEKEDLETNEYVEATLYGEYDPTVDAIITDKYTGSRLYDNFSLQTFIRMYRKIAEDPEVESLIDEIVQEAVVITDDYTPPVSIEIDSEAIKILEDRRLLHLSDDIINEIYKTFTNIIYMLNFHEDGARIFRRWFIDGRLYTYIIKDKDTGKTLGYTILDPLLLLGTKTEKNKVYYIYSGTEMFLQNLMNYSTYVTGFTSEPPPSPTTNYTYSYYQSVSPSYVPTAGENVQGELYRIEIPADQIVIVTSGLYDINYRMYISYLHRIIKPLNNLRLLEDGLVIYRLARAVPRLIFKIDTGGLPRAQAMEYIRQEMKKFRERYMLKYNTETGELIGEKRIMSLLDDFWLPANSQTSIDTLEPRSPSWSDIMDECLYFRMKILRALKIPPYRFILPGELGERYRVSGDEAKHIAERSFHKFIQSLRKEFSKLFDYLLVKELVENGVLSYQEYALFRTAFRFKWRNDEKTNESKISTIMNKFEAAERLLNLVGKFISKRYIYREVLDMSDEEIEKMIAEMELEKEKETVLSQKKIKKDIMSDAENEQANQNMQNMGGEFESSGGLGGFGGEIPGLFGNETGGEEGGMGGFGNVEEFTTTGTGGGGMSSGGFGEETGTVGGETTNTPPPEGEETNQTNK